MVQKSLIKILIQRQNVLHTTNITQPPPTPSLSTPKLYQVSHIERTHNKPTRPRPLHTAPHSSNNAQTPRQHPANTAPHGSIKTTKSKQRSNTPTTRSNTINTIKHARTCQTPKHTKQYPKVQKHQKSKNIKTELKKNYKKNIHSTAQRFPYSIQKSPNRPNGPNKHPPDNIKLTLTLSLTLTSS